MSWQPIETAPREPYARIVCWRAGWDQPVILMWKDNHRIRDAHAAGESMELAEWYFGDTEEYDDYHLAERGNGPTHWHPLAPFPAAAPKAKTP